MGWTLLAVVLGAALALPAAAPAGKASDGTLSVQRGRGKITLNFKGTAVGRLANGKVRIRDQNLFDGLTPEFRHCKSLKQLNAHVTVCTGKKLTFRALNGRYTVFVQGSGIFMSAVGRGTLTVDGGGDNGLPDGVMSLDDAPYTSLPDVPTVFALGTTKTKR
ncbi:MAG TPA: hypothetical protein VLU96_07910 [Gaiellaceae bacterium]|nr:hypothetical protein [Gaiellaceae bacterium]